MTPTEARPQRKEYLYAVLLKLAPVATAQITLPCVIGSVMQAARAGHVPTVDELVALGQTETFAGVFVERLGYLLRLRQAGTLRAAGPFADLKEGLYLCNAKDEGEARLVLENDPFYRAGLIEREFTVRKWLAAF